MNVDNATDSTRRHFLRVATGLIAGAGIVGASIPFVRSMLPSVRARSQGASVSVDTTKVEPGQQVTIEWRGKPVWVLRRTEAMRRRLRTLTDSGELLDPESEEPQQPDYVSPELRSRYPELLVVVGICTHLGCVPTFRPDVAPPDLGADWLGGYFCPCHGSKFDLAGRVYKGVPAPLNLVIPPHRFDVDGIVTIGEDPQGG
jgi:ubiquinol-cytochrome c reductase iron-sulfur subunit